MLYASSTEFPHIAIILNIKYLLKSCKHSYFFKIIHFEKKYKKIYKYYF